MTLRERARDGITRREPAIRLAFNVLLVGNGYTVLAARDGAEALQISDSHPGRIHVVLTDLVMPGLTGRSTAEGIALTRPDTKVLYISGYSREAVIGRGALRRDAAFLSKPFTLDDLLRSLRELLGHPRHERVKPATPGREE